MAIWADRLSDSHAGMRELYQTGYMHNRVRISWARLVKNLRCIGNMGIPFWDCLCDADHAANSASWQWIAGCGADVAPYFRVFNPITQAEKLMVAHITSKNISLNWPICLKNI